MKNSILKTALALTLFTGIFSVTARAGDPCAPTVRARDSYMACRNPSTGNYYSLTFQTMMSPISKACPIEKNVEVTSVKVEVSTSDSEKAAVIQIEPGFFKAERNAPGMDSSFSSPILGIDLQGCSTPADGGLSSGN